MSRSVQTHLVDGGLADVEQAEQDGVQAEEDVVGADGVDPLRVPLQKLLLGEKHPLISPSRTLRPLVTMETAWLT